MTDKQVAIFNAAVKIWLQKGCDAFSAASNAKEIWQATEAYTEVENNLIENSPMSMRTINSLTNAGYTQLSQLTELDEKKLWKTKSIGTRSIREIKNVLLSRGMHLKE